MKYLIGLIFSGFALAALWEMPYSYNANAKDFLQSSEYSSSCKYNKKTHELLDATLWIQLSAEYRMVTSQAFHLARFQLQKALKDPDWTASVEQAITGTYRDRKKLAIIFDVDETLISNVKFQEQIILEGTQYSGERWNNWVQAKKAIALEGAVDFVNWAKDKADIFYVTNRLHKNAEYTAENLRSLGFPIENPDIQLLSKKKRNEWGSDKSNRREYIGETHRIILLFGDDLNDFVSGVKATEKSIVTPEGRRFIAEKYKAYWGTKWIILPNPMYGSSEQALYFFQKKWSRNKKNNSKLDKLEGFINCDVN